MEANLFLPSITSLLCFPFIVLSYPFVFLSKEDISRERTLITPQYEETAHTLVMENLFLSQSIGKYPPTCHSSLEN